MSDKVTISAPPQMKRGGQKNSGNVVRNYQIRWRLCLRRAIKLNFDEHLSAGLPPAGLLGLVEESQ